MQELTTFRHDYVPKPSSRLDPIIPVAELIISDKPMEGDTTMTASYRPPGVIERVSSYKPVLCYKQPDMPFIGDTIHRLSYVPQPLCEKEFFPWQQKPTYKCPEVEVEGNTIYKASFRAPGRFVPCGTSSPCNECCPSAKQDCCKASCFDPCCPGVC
ncbi:stabilizer of axonemal microtubules 1 [Anabrus simplex]|uniref:stabilizer of axonemal microtubules 1 n=1 Tax=Anabrus simplex TaxID=316456 RepID=UPI0034DD45E1